MRRTLTIAQRELASLFFSPIAYVTLGLFALGTTWIFFRTFGPGEEATLRPTFQWVVWMLIFIVPAISMRLISEEFRSGTIEPLMTAPINETHVVLGKWLGAFGFFVVLLVAPFIVLIGVLEMTADPEYGPIITGLLGLILVGGLYLAIGTFASAATKDQIISFLLTATIICVFTIVVHMIAQAGFVSNDMARALNHVNIFFQYADFAKGVLTLSNFVLFLSAIALFLFMAVKVLESRRWR
ncbi:MAG: ABC transporter permease [Phycisphaeraceae bacterium]